MVLPAVITSPAALRSTLATLRAGGRRIGFVPTMGALHAGHLSLVEAARRSCDTVVVSIFVNPTQFAAGEDLAHYPRQLDKDCALLAEHQVDVVFAPTAEEMYPPGFATRVELSGPALPLEGGLRPGHFSGVATVVLKLFQIVEPQVAYFGQKDYQQALVVRRLVQDLNLPLTIEVCPIVRDVDGLALSSRNVYLLPAERQRALSLSRGLRLAADLVRDGERSAAAIEERLTETLLAAGAQIDYAAVVDPDTLLPVFRINGPTLLVLAARIGRIRLIDNRLLDAPVAKEPASREPAPG